MTVFRLESLEPEYAKRFAGLVGESSQSAVCGPAELTVMKDHVTVKYTRIVSISRQATMEFLGDLL